MKTKADPLIPPEDRPRLVRLLEYVVVDTEVELHAEEEDLDAAARLLVKLRGAQ